MRVSNISNFIVRKSDYNNWESVLKKPRSISIETLNTGRIVCKISGLLNLKNIYAKELKDGVVNTPVLAHIIRHEKYNVLMFLEMVHFGQFLLQDIQRDTFLI